jgi:hypothetical protein
MGSIEWNDENWDALLMAAMQSREAKYIKK